jgi:hypothetical protein
MHHPGCICGGSSPEVASPEMMYPEVTGSCITERRELEPEMQGRYFPHFFPVFSAFFLTGTSLDSMYGQSNCESNMYRVTIALLPPLAMLNHFLNP